MKREKYSAKYAWKFEIQLEGRVKWSLTAAETSFCNGTASPQRTYGHSAVTARDQMIGVLSTRLKPAATNSGHTIYRQPRGKN